MSKVQDIHNRSMTVDDIQQRLNANLKGGDGGGTFDGMEKRVENLEKDVREVKTDLTDIKVTLARIETELAHKISYKWLTIYVLGLAALILRHEILSIFNSTP